MPETAASVPKQPAPTTARPNGAEGLRRYLRESRLELKKVNWPTQQQVINLTLVVLVVCVVIALFLGGVDALFATLVKWLAA